MIILLFLLTCKATAQQEIGLRIGANLGHLNFTNSLGEETETLKSKSGIFVSLLLSKKIGSQQKGGKYRGYGNQGRHRNPFQHEVLFGVGFKSTTIEDVEINAPKKFNLSYTSSSVSYRFTATIKDIGMFGGVGVVGDYMISGTQFNNGTPLDISSQIKRFNASIMAEAGLSFSMSAGITAVLRISHDLGLSNLEKSADQKAKLSHTQIGLGMFFRI